MDHAHIPDPLQWSGLMTILYLANYFELYSALAHWYYPVEDDVRGFKASVKNRMRARKLVLWFFENHTLSSPTTVLKGSEALEKIYVSFLAHQAKLLVLYKRKAWKAGLRGDPVKVTPKTFSRNVEECLKEGPGWLAYQSTTIGSSQRSFSWHGIEYHIEHMETPVHISFPFLDGFVYGDREMIQKLKLSIRPTVDLTRTGAGTLLDADLEEESEDSEYLGGGDDMGDEFEEEDGSTSMDLHTSKRRKDADDVDDAGRQTKKLRRL
ncbi:hypothetical protein C0992_010909 [Termitomyces sp. T32_za158]|nr:hypothetical protein C0992_010909 [Termitomyces sp. T32_za158]